MNNLTGKDNSLEELIAENQPRLKAFIRKRVSTKEDAEDILQDVLYQLVKTIESTFNPHRAGYSMAISRSTKYHYQ